MGKIACFYMEETDLVQKTLRCFTYSSVKRCPQTTYGHDASVPIEIVQAIYDDRGGLVYQHPDMNDPRWPVQCQCGYVFSPEDEYQLQQDQIYRRVDTGDLHTVRNCPVGAMYFADWYPHSWRWFGDDGKCLVVRCPGSHDWIVDSQASNCTRPDEPHKCWVRHGDPPNVTVDKQGNTCEAGAGSIIVPGWHGFLRNGYLEDC